MSAKHIKASTAQIMRLQNTVKHLQQEQRRLFSIKQDLRHFNTRNENEVNRNIQHVNHDLYRTANVLRSFSRRLKKQQLEMQRHTKSLNRNTHKRSSTHRSSRRRSVHN